MFSFCISNIKMEENMKTQKHKLIKLGTRDVFELSDLTIYIFLHASTSKILKMLVKVFLVVAF